ATSTTGVVSGSRPAAITRTTRSRSVTTPTIRSLCTTGSEPMSCSRMSRAASVAVADVETVRGLTDMMSAAGFMHRVYPGRRKLCHDFERLADLRDPALEPLEQHGDIGPRLRIGEIAVLVELVAGARDQYLVRERLRAGKEQRLAHLALGVRRAADAGRGAHDRDRFAVEHRLPGRARGPVDGVLQHTRRAAVVLRGREEDGVRVADRVPQVLDRLGRPGLLHVAVVERQVADVVDLDVHAARRELLRGAQEPTVVRSAAKAAGDPEDAHRPYAALTAEIDAVKSTRSPSRLPPASSSCFQSTP